MSLRAAAAFGFLVACGGGASKIPPSALAPPAASASPTLDDSVAATDAAPMDSATPPRDPTPRDRDAADALRDASDAGAMATDAGPAFDFALVESVVKQHKEAVRAACWDRSKSTEKAYAATLSLRIGPTGNVVTVDVEGTDAVASKCVAKEAKRWVFPKPNGTATIKVPLRLRRD